MHKSLRLGKLLVIPYDSFSNYVNLPSSILERISKMKNQHLPYHFELKTSYDLVTYVGVKEFTAPDDCIEVPTWLAEQLADDYLMVTFLKDIPKGDYVKIQPQEKKFFDLPEADKILESALSNYCLLNIDQIIQVNLLDDIYKIKIVEIKSLDTDTTHELIEITNMDLKVDIDNIFPEEKIKPVELPIPKTNTLTTSIDSLNTDFSNMFKEDNTNKEDNAIKEGIKLGGTYVPIDEVRLARLKYLEKKGISTVSSVLCQNDNEIIIDK